jgi:homogentisate 1,2-dioxygenase
MWNDLVDNFSSHAKEVEELKKKFGNLKLGTAGMR